jgi:hypothetical protein
MGTRGCSHHVKWPMCEVDHSSPSTANFKNEYIYTSVALCAFRDNFIFVYFKIFLIIIITMYVLILVTNIYHYSLLKHNPVMFH